MNFIHKEIRIIGFNSKIQYAIYVHNEYIYIILYNLIRANKFIYNYIE